MERVLAAGVLDSRGLLGSAAVAAELPARELRRLDPLSQGLVRCAAAALGPGPLALASETALVLASTRGCLDADLAFQQSLAPGAEAAPQLFPLTLPSACLGELARRWKLTGPTVCLSAERPPEHGQALDEACALLRCGEARAALVAFGDALSEEMAAKVGVAPRLELGLVLVGEGEGWEVEPLRAAQDPWAFLRERLGAAR